jgi:hypothetical protein
MTVIVSVKLVDITSLQCQVPSISCINFRMNTDNNLADYFNLNIRFSLTTKLNVLLLVASEIYLRRDDTEFTYVDLRIRQYAEII